MPYPFQIDAGNPNRDVIAATIARADIARADYDREALDAAWWAVAESDANAEHKSLARGVLMAAEVIFEQPPDAG
jgi:hypothetical protein